MAGALAPGTRILPRYDWMGPRWRRPCVVVAIVMPESDFDISSTGWTSRVPVEFENGLRPDHEGVSQSWFTITPNAFDVLAPLPDFTSPTSVARWLLRED